MPARIKKNHHSKKSRHSGAKSSNGKQEKGVFRVIAGDLRSRKFEFPVLDGLRPTTDRVKETVFNWIQSHIEGAKVLDLFTGSGSMSFEAISRGADFVQMFEKSTIAVKSIKNNLELARVASDKADIKCIDTFKALSDADVINRRQYDIVLIDPPFRKGFLQDVVNLLDQSQSLNNRAYIYIEQEKEGDQPVLPSSWKLVKEKQAGQVAYHLYEHCISVKEN